MNQKPSPSKKTDKNLLAAMGYCPILFFVPLLSKENEVAKQCSNQGLLLLISFMAIRIVQAVIGMILKYPAILVVDWLFVVMQMVLGFCMAIGMVTGYEQNDVYELPIIGHINVLEKLRVKGEDKP